MVKSNQDVEMSFPVRGALLSYHLFYLTKIYYLNQPINVLTNAFGMPSGTQASGQLGIWFYDKMKVDWQGTNYTKINVIVGKGRVVKITIDPRSAMGEGNIDPNAEPTPE